MIIYKGELSISRELTSSEIVKLRLLLDTNIPNTSKPNNGLSALKFSNDFKTLVWNGSEVYELEGVIRDLIPQLPQYVNLNGIFTCVDDAEGGFSNKIIVDNNILYFMGVDEELADKPKLLKCPHCQKAFKAEDFKEVIG